MTYFACEKMNSRSENTRSAAAKEGYTNKTDLHASA